MKPFARLLLCICLLLGLGRTVLAQSDTDRQVNVIRFEPGKSAITLSGSIKGYQYIDYTLKAEKGQQLTVSMVTKHTSTYYNILPPGSQDVAIYNASINGLQYSGELTESGEYTIRVYMMRSAARRKEKASFTLQVGVEPKP
ncbi:hypothetical protein KJS94_15145 [Flavihumibacter rivuli]|uniref:hypothetical protein n=1 Tax=Flavihumibacter rivuli TaxID=2838156 RepID=UPI001BDE0496|nr:hypothetical protein [Flavihumibacter rivuli]ULQ55984.1 hypothetical protein KJS94_15145 [Flavihumibacter rivuli]